jgi:hypothetical protein
MKINPIFRRHAATGLLLLLAVSCDQNREVIEDASEEMTEVCAGTGVSRHFISLSYPATKGFTDTYAKIKSQNWSVTDQGDTAINPSFKAWAGSAGIPYPGDSYGTTVLVARAKPYHPGYARNISLDGVIFPTVGYRGPGTGGVLYSVGSNGSYRNGSTGRSTTTCNLDFFVGRGSLSCVATPTPFNVSRNKPKGSIRRILENGRGCDHMIWPSDCYDYRFK